MEKGKADDAPVNFFAGSAKVLLAVALERLFALKIAGLIDGLADLEGEVGELRLNGRGDVRIASVADKDFDTQLDSQIGRVLREHGLEADEMVARGGGREEEAVAALALLLAGNSVSGGILNQQTREQTSDLQQRR